MKKLYFLLLSAFFFLMACKQDKVDGSSLKAFQESTNEMASSLSTLEQIKFNEALYIIKTFGVNAEGDTQRLNTMAKLLQGKTVAEIMALANEIAQKEGIAWRSDAPPSLGNMKIFDEETSPNEKDPTDVEANSLLIDVRAAVRDSITGVKGIQITPKLADNQGAPIVFENAALETIMEVYSGGQKLHTAKNIMQNNRFKGFTLLFSSLPADKITDGAIDITLTVYTKAKALKMTRIGEMVNMKALKAPIQKPESVEDIGEISEDPKADETPKQDPKTTVQRFLQNVSTQNLRAAYEVSNNPAWGSFDKFSNPNSGFGNVQNLSVKNISGKPTQAENASVQATYEITDKNGNTSTVNATFLLKYTQGEWKIVGYKL